MHLESFPFWLAPTSEPIWIDSLCDCRVNKGSKYISELEVFEEKRKKN